MQHRLRPAGAAEWLSEHKYLFLLLYYPVWFLWFQLLEKRNAHVTLWIKSPLDDYIPFISVFVIPYVLWFAYVGVTLVITGLKDKTIFLKLCASIYIGMTISNIVYYFIPHGQPLRVPLTGGESDIFSRMVYAIYAGDTPTNCAPSIHVLNSLAVDIAIQKSAYFKDKKWIRAGSAILNILIILSTMFIKQHSVVDVALGLVLGGGIYLLVYTVDWRDIWQTARKSLSPQRSRI